jgi:hypothetical protein
MFNNTLSSHRDLMRDGWDYQFSAYPADNVQDTADRAVFRLFQTYPTNEVQGFGELTSRAESKGYHFRAFQPVPMVVNTQTQLLADMYGSGTAAGSIAMQALISG